LVRVQDPENHAVLLIGSGLAGAKSSYWSASARLTTHALQLLGMGRQLRYPAGQPAHVSGDTR